MIESAFVRLWRELRPAEGWLPVLLLLAIVSTLVAAVGAVGWVPEGSVVIWTAALGSLLGSVLAKRPIRWSAAWALILGYGLAVVVIRLGRLWPPPSAVLDGWGSSSAYIRQQSGLLVDRIGGWLEAVSGNGRSEETIVFALGLGLLVWLLSAYAGWSTFRHHRPLAGLTAMGFGLAVNGFYGDAPLWLAAIFIGLAALLVASVHYADLEQKWANRRADFSTEIRMDLLVYSGAIALVLLVIAFILPTINFRAISRFFLDRPAVHQAEERLSQAFAGVQQPQGDLGNMEPGGAAGFRGSLPRSFLLGNPPELSETVVMTATVSGDYRSPNHWRGLSYDIYTGRGWALSDERQEPLPANQALPQPIFQGQIELDQSIHWRLGNATSRYTLGQPLQFDHQVVTFWRGLEDLSRVQGQKNDYRAISQISGADVAALRQASLTEVPTAIMARYTQLPDSVPERVHDLAIEVAGAADIASNPYDQARALENFLRQYPYSLEVELPPIGADPVDFFLFDLQAGYCDYYASAMVVLARALGLPARLAIGFLAQEPDEQGTQTVYQINAHSWTEVYFADYGWVEFEPTAAFPARDAASSGELITEAELEGLVPFSEPPPIPAKEPSSPTIPWWLALLALIPVAWWLWNRRQRSVAETDGIYWAYSRLLRTAQRLGQATPVSQTPTEFEAAFLGRLRRLERRRLASRLRLGRIYPEIERLTAYYLARQYAGKRPPTNAARASWRRIRRRLWLLGLINKLTWRREGAKQ